jgi:NAD(P)-dependent dehydrogenase (short-subunit alcohol dehydrogenase family)
VVKSKLVLAGSRGLLGREIYKYLSILGYEILELDLVLGHDLTNENFVREWFNKNNAEHLINCFALDDPVNSEVRDTTFFDISLDSFTAALNVNVVALFSVCREYIRNNEAGNIVNFSSIYSLVSPRPEMYGDGEKHVAYGVSKAAVNQLSAHLAVHAAPSFRVNTIVLGGVYNRQGEEFVANYESHVPLGRMGTAKDVFGLLEFLCSEKSDYVTGARIVIDGGWTLI